MKNNDITIGFLGLGLIGGSIARAIREAYPETHILVYTRRVNPDLQKGIDDKILDELVYEIDERLSVCDVIFLCAPVLKNVEFLHLLKPLIHDTCIVTDVGSVKGIIHQEAARLGMEKNFIGGHPMAGSEKTGYANSSSTLLKDSFYLLTPTPRTTEEDLKRLRALLSATRSNCIVLTPTQHDNITAAISHVPHLVAASLVKLVKDNDDEKEYMKAFAAGGFKDITRIASSSPEMWESICLSNRDSICSYLEQMVELLQEIQEKISEENGDYIKNLFQESGSYRNSIRDKT